MTWALCLNCGATKFGAICPCPDCGVASTGDMNLDIAFSDHHLSVSTLEGFGGVVRAIREVCGDDELRFWSFIHHVSQHHPDVLGVTLSADQFDRCAEVIARANPPPVEVEESDEARILGELDDDAEPGKPADGS